MIDAKVFTSTVTAEKNKLSIIAVIFLFVQLRNFVDSPKYESPRLIG